MPSGLKATAAALAVLADQVNQANLLATAAAAESSSEHPLARAIVDAAADQAKFAGDGSEGLEDQLGMEEKVEMTEEESKTKMEEVTKQFVSLCKNDTPEDGKTRAIRLMRETFKVQKLGELTHEQRLAWIKEMEKGILEHK